MNLFIDNIVCLVFNFFPQNFFFLCLMILQVKRHQKKEKQVVLSTSLNISREKFIHTCMYVGSHKLSEVLFTFSVLVLTWKQFCTFVLCIRMYVTMVVFVQFIFPIDQYILWYGADSQKISFRLHVRYKWLEMYTLETLKILKKILYTYYEIATYNTFYFGFC